MIRLLLASLVTSFAATASYAQTPIPKPMPGTVAPPAATSPAPAPLPTTPPAATSPAPAPSPLPTTPTVSHAMVADACRSEGGDCCEGGRCGLFCRLASRWSGHRYAYVDTTCCPTVASAPACTSYEQVSVSCDSRSRRFGVGRFLSRDCGERCGLLARFKAWICYHPTKCKLPHVPNPYSTHARHYFGPSAEPPAGCAGCPNGQCVATAAAIGVHCGGRVGCGVGCGSILGGRSGDGRIIGNGKGCDHIANWKDDGRLYTDAGGKLVPHHHHPKPGCWDLAGSPLVSDIRFAGNQRRTPPDINSGQPYNYKGSTHDLQYMKNIEVQPNQQVNAEK